MSNIQVKTYKMLLDAFEMTDRRVVGFIKVENAQMT